MERLPAVLNLAGLARIKLADGMDYRPIRKAMGVSAFGINAYTANARDMITTYAVLHANIQDKFFAAGVEIMSPHYTSIRDGNTVQIPEGQRPPGYRTPAFRVEHVGTDPRKTS